MSAMMSDLFLFQMSPEEMLGLPDSLETEHKFTNVSVIKSQNWTDDEFAAQVDKIIYKKYPEGDVMITRFLTPFTCLAIFMIADDSPKESLLRSQALQDGVKVITYRMDSQKEEDHV